ncbi:DUF899 domain-containing protein [Amycolatopsis acidicola]|uniref:DUF899 domain-containing protein n=1 Tax=Amycolatopsis acidicola TaxID=2596893 RepID=A0A5N0UYQ7_9PSEU|nr:DUF899 family protein [Amycolatopsis acidicola]KAA9157748.1 DUF899 domain-containing protein [Amycolatopsis acidicola]
MSTCSATLPPDALSRRRRELPMVKVEKNYVFEGLGGKGSLLDVFEGRRQLIVYHFMFGPDDTEGHNSCSLLVDTSATRSICLHSTPRSRSCRGRRSGNSRPSGNG